jgi:hypothetical protein
MKFEHHPNLYYYDAEGGIHMIDITHCIICGEALVSIVIGKVILSTPESRESDFNHSIESRLERFKLCGMTTVFDVVGHSYRLHQANRFDCMYERTGEMMLVAVCNPEFERFCEVGGIWFLHQHRMQPSHQRSYMTPSQRRMLQDNRRDLGTVNVEA